MPDYSDSHLLAMVAPKTDWATTLRFDQLEARHGLLRGLMGAVMQAESKGDPAAVSPKNAKGLFQLMDDTAKQYNADPFDPPQAAEAAAQELGTLYRKYQGNLQATLAAWNWGQGNVDRQGLAKAPDETKTFFSSVMGMLGPRAAEAAPRRAPGAQAQPGPSDDDLLKMLQPSAPAQAPQDAELLQRRAPAAPAPAAAPVRTPRPAPRQAEGSVEAVIGTPAPAPAASHALDMPPLTPGGAQLVKQRTTATEQALLPSDRGAPTGQGWKDLAALATSTAAGVGGAMTGPVAPVAIPALSYGARKLNVALGFEEPGLTGDILSAALPVAGGALVKGGKAVVRNLPGARAIGHELAGETLEKLPGRYAPGQASEDLFQQAAHHNPAIQTTALKQAATDIAQHEARLAPSFRQPELQRTAQDLLTVMQQHGGQVPLQVLDEYRQRLGLLIGQASAENWPRASGLRRMYAALYGDLDTAAARGVPGAETLTQATKASRQERAVDTLADLWSPGKGITTIEGNLANVHGKTILDRFDRLVAHDKLFRESFAPDDLPEIRKTLQDVAKMTRKSPADRGPLAGQTMQWIGRAAGIERAWHGDPLAAVAIGVTIQSAPYLIAAAIQTAPGRVAVREAFRQGDGRITSAGLAIIAKAMRDEYGEQPTPPAASQAPVPRVNPLRQPTLGGSAR